MKKIEINNIWTLFLATPLTIAASVWTAMGTDRISPETLSEDSAAQQVAVQQFEQEISDLSRKFNALEKSRHDALRDFVSSGAGEAAPSGAAYENAVALSRDIYDQITLSPDLSEQDYASLCKKLEAATDYNYYTPKHRHPAYRNDALKEILKETPDFQQSTVSGYAQKVNSSIERKTSVETWPLADRIPATMASGILGGLAGFFTLGAILFGVLKLPEKTKIPIPSLQKTLPGKKRKSIGPEN